MWAMLRPQERENQNTEEVQRRESLQLVGGNRHNGTQLFEGKSCLNAWSS